MPSSDDSDEESHKHSIVYEPDKEIYEHLQTREDYVTGGQITQHTTLVNIAGTHSTLVQDLTGIAQPYVPCQIENSDWKNLPPQVQPGHEKLYGYRLYSTYDKLLLAPVHRLECQFVSKTDVDHEPYLILVVEHHFANYHNASTRKVGIAQTYNLSDGGTLSFTADGATCSGFNEIERHRSKFGLDEAKIIECLRALLDPDMPFKVTIQLHYDCILDMSKKQRLQNIRKRLPGGSGMLLPSIGPHEYKAFKPEAQQFRFNRESLGTIQDSLKGPCKAPLVPLDCRNTFSTVDEAVVQLSESVICEDAESRQQLLFWAKVNHKGTLYMTENFPVLAVRFGNFTKLNSTDNGGYKLPKDLECKMTFQVKKLPSRPQRMAVGHLLSSNPGLPHHDAFFRLACTKKDSKVKWEKEAYKVEDREPPWSSVKLEPHYRSFTLNCQLATAHQLSLSSSKRWWPILLNQRHDQMPMVNPLAGMDLSDGLQEQAYTWLRSCKPWNAEQLQAIRGVKSTKGGMSIVMGPAGTGKTTLHKAMTLYFWILGFHILSITPANSNATQIADGMDVEKLTREFPGFDFSKFSFLRLFSASKEVTADKANSTANKKAGHEGGHVLSFTELLHGIDEYGGAESTARRFSVLSTIIRTALSGSKKPTIPSGQNPWQKLRELIDLRFKNGPEPSAEEDKRDYMNAFRRCKQQIIGENRFMITTTINARSNDLLESWFRKDHGPRQGVVVFVDEAAKDLEINVWNGILCEAWASHVRGVWLFGDEMQLKPTNTSLNTWKMLFNAHTDRMDIALPCRLVAEGFPFVPLKEQRRMHVCLSDFPNRKVYNGDLRDAPGMDKLLEDVKPGFKEVLVDIIAEHGVYSEEARAEFRIQVKDEDLRLHWIEIEGVRERQPNGTSSCVKAHITTFFGKILPGLLAYYQGREEKMVKEVMIICAYGWAVRHYEDGFRELIKTEPALSRANFPNVSEMPQHMTVDSSQGQEAFMVIFDGSFQDGRNIGFMRDPTRANVAMTRAREVFWILGGKMELKAGDKDSLVVQYKRELERAQKVHRFN